MRTASVLIALEQALHARRPDAGLIHHSDHGSQYLSIRYVERLAEAGIAPSVGSVGEPCDNALAETINGLNKTELIHPRGPWHHQQAVDYTTRELMDWINHRRLLQPVGGVPPAEFEQPSYNQLAGQAQAA